MAGVTTEIKTNRHGEVTIRVRREGKWGFTPYNLDQFRSLMEQGPDVLKRAEELAEAHRKAQGE